MFRALRRYADFSVRSNRAEFLLFALFAILFTWVGLFVAGYISSIVLSDQSGLSFVGLLGLWLLVILVPSLSVSVRRLHDVDMSGWWTMVGLLPGLGALALFVLHMIPGTPGPNRFGPPPGSVEGELAPAE